MKYLIILLLLVGGSALMKYSYQVAQFFGRSRVAERYLGPGSTLTMWRLISLAVILAAFFVLAFG